MIFLYSFSFVAAGSLACRPSVQIYPIILTIIIVILVTIISVLKSYNYNQKYGSTFYIGIAMVILAEIGPWEN